MFVDDKMIRPCNEDRLVQQSCRSERRGLSQLLVKERRHLTLLTEADHQCQRMADLYVCQLCSVSLCLTYKLMNDLKYWWHGVACSQPM